MTEKTNPSVLIVGLGLLGGSYAMALSRRGLSVSAITQNEEDIVYAKQQGWIVGGTTAVDPQLVAAADLVVFALYPHVFEEWIAAHGHLFSPGTLITDVTGVKGDLIGKIQAQLPPGVEFIAAHPMAGREVSGVRNADDRIFRDANYIVVPTDKNTPEGIAACERLGRWLGFARISRLSAAEHDEMIAFLSQLTHGIAVSLMCANDNPDLVAYTGDSFRDLTRIARINDEMWSELFLRNRTALLTEMERFRAAFDRLYRAVEQNDRDTLRDMMRLSTERRARFDR